MYTRDPISGALLFLMNFGSLQDLESIAMDNEVGPLPPRYYYRYHYQIFDGADLNNLKDSSYLHPPQKAGPEQLD